MNWKKILIWAAISIAIVPIIINFVLQIPAITVIVGDNIDWLHFYGSYLGSIIGSIIGAIVTIYVLRKTIKYYRKKDSYQHDMDWLNEFRKICSEYIRPFNSNNIQMILYEMVKDAQKAYYHCGLHINNCMDKDTKMSFIINSMKDADLDNLYKTLNAYHTIYRDSFNDLQKVLCAISNAEQLPNYNKTISFKSLETYELSEDFKVYIIQYSTNGIFTIAQIHNLLSDWFDKQEKSYQYYQSMSGCIREYISLKRIEIENEYK